MQQRTLIETFVRTLGEAGERGGFGFRAKEGCGDSVPRQNAAENVVTEGTRLLATSASMF